MKPKAIHRAVIEWYSGHKRDLPWRRNKDPYRIWISEIMLQQTRVETVIPYFERFLSHFPTVQDLADAPEDTLLNLWAGLGYYSRARNLKIAANQIREEFSGIFPSRLEDLRSLKGVGPYTSAAIASIAFDQPVAAIDGNLERVFARLLASKKNPKLEGKKEIEEFGASLAAHGKASELNQGIMDLASKICLPKIPKCEICPLHSLCQARKQGIQVEIPKKKEKSAAIELNAQGLILVCDRKLLLARRPKGTWLAGMWDIPWWITKESEKFSTKTMGEIVNSCAQIRTITKHKIYFQVDAVQGKKIPSDRILKKIPLGAQEFKWVELNDLHGVNLPRPSEKALEESLTALE